jgi:hypothetical protein
MNVSLVLDEAITDWTLPLLDRSAEVVATPVSTSDATIHGKRLIATCFLRLHFAIALHPPMRSEPSDL